jgi:hypothetical protein
MMAFLQLRWLGRERLLAYSRILVFACVASLGFIFLEAMGSVGSDFLAFWSAGKLAVAGKAAVAYDPVLLARIQATVGRRDVFAFVNPPPLLLAIWPLGLLDYPAAWGVWIAATYSLWLAATRRLYPELSWPIAAYPGALLAAWHAQTGFLTSAIQAAAAGMLRERPFIAGLFVGALIIKPHLAVLFPVAFLAGRHWRAIAGAVVSVVGLLALSWLIFGTATMLAYPKSWTASNYLLTTSGDVFFLRQVTIYAMARVALSSQVGLVAQALVTLAMAALTWRAWARPGPVDGKLALLFAATPLATPYLFSYDLPFLVIPVCWLIEAERERGFPSWSRTWLMLLYLSPLLARALALPAGINPMPLVSIVTVWWIWRRLDEPFRPAPVAGK